MKIPQSAALSSDLEQQLAKIGELLTRLRQARHLKQGDAALRAGLSRTTAYRIEKGDPGVAVGQLVRYLDAISPGTSLVRLMAQDDPSLAALQTRESSKRVRGLTERERKDLDF